MSLHNTSLLASLALCTVVLLASQSLAGLPVHGPAPAPVLPTEFDAASPSWRGGRGPEHCALSIGIFLGGALAFWVNPFLGTQAMRLGLMASVLHCA